MDIPNIPLVPPQKFVKRHNSEKYDASPYRTTYQRDCDRIMYSKEFRRLSGKTQVFLTQSHDHIRTRLTHTLEVAQIARVVARNLNLSTELSEAIAYGHDVGHTPFGHVGEQALSYIMNNCDTLAGFQERMQDSDKGFKHNLQSVRVTCDLEQSYGRKGLNLTNFTLWGIKNHSSVRWKECNCRNINSGRCHLKRNDTECEARGDIKLNFYDHYDSWLYIKNHELPAWSFEGFLVSIADEIAQRHHDIEDALIVGLITQRELVEKLQSLFQSILDRDDGLIFNDLEKSIGNHNLFLQNVSKFIVHFLSRNLIRNSCEKLQTFIHKKNIKSKEDFSELYPQISLEEASSIINYSEDLIEADKLAQKFLRGRILNSFQVQRMDGKGNFIIRNIFKAYLTNPRQLHDSTIYYVFRQFQPDTYSNWSDITKEDLGEMRNEIDSAILRSDDKFQICLLRAICDHLAGMTDRFAMEEYKRLYG